MRGIIKFFLRNTVAANLLMVFILIMGYFGLIRLKTTFFPENPSRIIAIQLIYPGASPEEMEEGIVFKIEENLVGIPGVKQTSSRSSENAATVTVEAELGVDTDVVLQDVKNAVDQINSFPASLEPPIIYKQTRYSDSYIFSLSGAMELKTLKKYARIAEEDLLKLDGISKVEISGYPEEEIEIAFRESDMQALNITFDEAVLAIGQNNLLTTGGTIKSSTEDLLIRAKNKEYYAEDLGEIVVRSNSNGGTIKLHQIATVRDQWVDNPTRTFVNGEPAVIVKVSNTTEEDMFQNSETTVAYLKKFTQRYPNVRIETIKDGKEYLNGRIEFIKENGLIGFLLVLILLAMFLNWRLAFWVALAIPISFAGMFMISGFTGLTINVISTFGMIVVIGILVDDGIVIAENIYQHYERGSDAFTAALEGTMEVLPAVTSAIVTTVIAFSTFFFIDGRLGDVFPMLSIVVICTLVFSLIEGALILPAHIAHSKALQEGSENKVTAFFDRIMNYMKHKIYGPILRFSMNYPFPTIAVCFAGLILTVGAFQGGIIGATFFPSVQSDEFKVTIEMPSGANEAQVISVMDRVEQAAKAVNKELSDKNFNGEKDVIEVIQKNVGPTSNLGNMTLYLLEGEIRDTIKNRMIIQKIRRKLGPVPEADQLIFGASGFFGDPVSISLLGTDSKELEGAVEELKSEMGKIADLTDIQDSNRKGLKELSVVLKPKAQNLGFTLGSIMRSVRQGFFGSEIQRLQRGRDEVRVWVRFDKADRSSVKNLLDMRIRTATGQAIPLSELVTLKSERGVIAISHLNGQKEIRVTADVSSDNAPIADINSDIKTVLLPSILNKYPGVSVGFEGQAKSNAEAAASMQKVLPLILLCMFFVITLTFSSVSQAMIVFALIPFGFIGVGLGHWFWGTSISVLSFLGVIALIGIMVNDALVFISAFNENIKRGDTFEDALYKTGISRFRPILLTTVTTVAGLLPLLLEKSVQAQFLIPMAISVAFGLIVATFILLVIIPALMKISNRVKLATTQIWYGEKFLSAQVEPSYPNRKHPWILTLLAAIILLALVGSVIYISLKYTESFI